MNVTLNLRIDDLRRYANLTQAELAEKIGATLSMVGKLERGERELTTSWIIKLCLALNCSPGDLFAGLRVTKEGT